MDLQTLPGWAPDSVAGPFTAVVVPVREADTIVRQRLLQVHPTLLPRDHSLAARITLLAPFLPPDEVDAGVVAELARCFAAITPFEFRLGEVCEFPGGPTYLAPEPPAPFRRLTQQLHRIFPEFPPYGGAFDEVVPHLTVPLAPGEDTTTLRETLQRTLPLHAHAVGAAVLQVAENDTHVIASLPFGTTAA